ncbi:FAD-dependent oxidoreductase [Luteimonas sp. BDR2-5]|uniref:FAD-dependent oxidoreductase n=1 Tax=Proluteimonas luteida TaxID=2878685 RepID=UPI0031C57531|nr:FAD-dependent oxidoreductase [Luteimonas sp. BDR2-5]
MTTIERKNNGQATDPAPREDNPRVSRRAFLKAAGVGAAGATLGVVHVASAQEHDWNEQTDVVVVGSGGAALAAAVGALQHGAEVTVLEKAPILGGTTAKSGGAFWVPNNPHMQAKGIADPKPDAMKYMARLAYPHLYRANHPTLGIAQLDYDLLSVFYDEGPRITALLAEAGALQSQQQLGATGLIPDYQGQLPENKSVVGRTLQPSDRDGAPGFGGDMIGQLSAFAGEHGASIREEHAVTRILVDSDRRVVGVEVDTPHGAHTIRARKGVVFGSGGFTHDIEMRNNYLRMPVLGGCAVPTNQGDFVRMAIEIGAKLGNMSEAWLQQEVLEEVLEYASVPMGAFLLGGDSMIVVNKLGHRMYDEKHVYNERTRSHAVWDPTLGEYVNLYQFMLFDDHAITYGGAQLMPPVGADLPAHVISAPTWDALAQAIQARLDGLADRIGEFRLHDDFLVNLGQTVERFNVFADNGVDLDFHRGELPIQQAFHVPGSNNDKPNKHMYPFAANGPYYCIILGPGTLDTKGGPVTNVHAQVLDVHDKPIPGLYAAGNCASSPSGQSYWGAGGTLGLALTYGYIAGAHAAGQR